MPSRLPCRGPTLSWPIWRLPEAFLRPRYIQGLGVVQMAVAHPDEDPVTLATEAARRCLMAAGDLLRNRPLHRRYRNRGRSLPSRCRLICTGLLGLPSACRVFETKHACFGGTRRSAQCGRLAGGGLCMGPLCADRLHRHCAVFGWHCGRADPRRRRGRDADQRKSATLSWNRGSPAAFHKTSTTFGDRSIERMRWSTVSFRCSATSTRSLEPMPNGSA